MAKKILTATLSVSSIKKLQSDLLKYKSKINEKCKTFVQKLADLGIETAKHNVGDFRTYIAFYTEIEANQYGYTSLAMATETGKIVNRWETQEGVKSADVSPLLMAEFGSGLMAKNPLNISGVGQGTFPDQTHAFNQSGWYWKDLDGIWHHSKGISPSAPMYKAYLKMNENIIRIAKEVFG